MLSKIFNLLASPVLLPLIISGLTWLVNTYTTVLQKLPNVVTRVLILVVPVLLVSLANWTGQHLGVPLDISSVNAAAGSVVAMLIFHIGKSSSSAP